MIPSDSMSTQVNIRLDDNLIDEIDSIARVLHVSRTEYLRMKIALIVKNDTINLSEAIALEYAKGHITEEELRHMLGTDADDVIYIVKNMKRGKKYIKDMVDKGLL